MKLFRVTLEISDPPYASKFYSKLLGIEGREVGGGRTYFDCGGVILTLLEPQEIPRPIPNYIYFTVDDLEAVYGRAQELHCLATDEKHAHRAGEIVTRPWGERSFYAEDPWGNKLCFV